MPWLEALPRHCGIGLTEAEAEFKRSYSQESDGLWAFQMECGLFSIYVDVSMHGGLDKVQ